MARKKNKQAGAGKSSKVKATSAKKKVSSRKQKKEQPPQPPHVSLLPPRLEIEKRRQSTKRSLAIIFTGFVVAWGIAIGAQIVLNHFASVNVDTQQSNLDDAAAERSKYSHIQQFLDDIDARQNMITGLQGDQLNYVTTSNDILAALNGGLELDSISMNLVDSSSSDDAVALAGSCGPVVDPIGISGADIVGCVSATITGPSGVDVAALTERLSNSEYLLNVNITSATNTDTSADGASVGSTLKVTAAIEREGLLFEAPDDSRRPNAANQDQNTDAKEGSES